jgi:hypothetical protein
MVKLRLLPTIVSHIINAIDISPTFMTATTPNGF